MSVAEKQVERVTRRIRQERVAERDRDVDAYLRLPLMEKVRSPINVPIDLAVVEMDGGRLQIVNRCGTKALDLEDAEETETADPEDGEEARHGHWREDKIGVLMTMTSEVSATDPCPKIPEHFVDPTRILKLVREIKSGVSVPERDEPDAADDAVNSEPNAETPWIPRPELRATVASRAPAKRFKQILAHAAWSLGFATAKRKAFVADGAAVNWTTHQHGSVTSSGSSTSFTLFPTFRRSCHLVFRGFSGSETRPRARPARDCKSGNLRPCPREGPCQCSEGASSHGDHPLAGGKSERSSLPLCCRRREVC